MALKGFLLYLLSCFILATLLAIYFNHRNHPDIQNEILLVQSLQTEKRWPILKFSWRLVLATIIGFLGSACGTVGGVGGGGIFVPMLTVIVGFDTKSAAALSKCMIMGASASSVWYNLRVAHPTREAPIINYSLALLFQPMLMLGITIGVALSVVFPYWLITLLTIVLFMGTSGRSFYKGIEMWKEETISMNEASINGEENYDEPLIPHEPMTKFQLMCFNVRWTEISVLVIVWVIFLVIQILKAHVSACSLWYWVLFNLQFPVALAVFFSASVKIYKKYRMRRCSTEFICEASIEWSLKNIALCALCSVVGGTVGGLLGSGGGFILGPLLLEIGVIPQVASATATFVMMFSSSLSVVEFYVLKRFPIPYALYLGCVSIVSGFWGQYLVRKVIGILGRASIIVFILSAVIFASALTMGAVGIVTSISMIRNHSFMGFLDFCSNQ